MAARALGAAGNAPGRGTPDTKGDYDIGLDAFYNVTPALKANFTFNTDFAETEVDQRRTNLTRFPLFFPEKREFFLDGDNFFSFPSGEATPFFSRRIGLNAGEPQPIVFGAKLIGQIGRQDVGFLQVTTSEENLTVRGAPSCSFTANTTTWTCREGSFTTRLYRVDARTQFSPWVSLTNNVQFDSESGQVGWQLRFRWIQKPGNDLFFIWTQNWWDDTVRGFKPLDRRGAAKIVRTFRF